MVVISFTLKVKRLFIAFFKSESAFPSSVRFFHGSFEFFKIDLLGLLDSERMIGHGTPIKDNIYLSIPEKEFLIFIAYFSQNLHFVFHSKFEFPSMMEADLCNKFLSAHRQAAQKIINMRIQDKVRSASIMEGNSKFK